MRFLLILTVIIAVAVLLRGSWQAGRRPFYFTLAAVVVVALLFIGAWLLTDQERHIAADPTTVQVSVKRVRLTETGVRISGDITNQGDNAVANARLRAEALHCPPATACQVIYSRELPLSMHIPPSGRYPLAITVDRPSTPIDADRWRVQVLSVDGYGD